MSTKGCHVCNGPQRIFPEFLQADVGSVWPRLWELCSRQAPASPEKWQVVQLGPYGVVGNKVDKDEKHGPSRW